METLRTEDIPLVRQPLFKAQELCGFSKLKQSATKSEQFNSQVELIYSVLKDEESGKTSLTIQNEVRSPAMCFYVYTTSALIPQCAE